MKKMILLAAGAVLLVAAVSAFVYVKNENNSMREMFNANVEALARGESGGSWTMCSQIGNDGKYLMPLCKTCGSRRYYDMDIVAYCN